MMTETAKTFRKKLRRGFSDLRRAGYLARMNFMCCQGCGFAKMEEMAEKTGVVRGLVFYHQQDAERINEKLGVYLSFGATNGDESEIVRVGQCISRIMENVGLEVEWDGTSARRPFISMPKQGVING